MSMYNLIEYNDNYSKTLWQYHRDNPKHKIRNFEPIKFKVKITVKSPADGNTKNVKMVLPLI